MTVLTRAAPEIATTAVKHNLEFGRLLNRQIGGLRKHRKAGLFVANYCRCGLPLGPRCLT